MAVAVASGTSTYMEDTRFTGTVQCKGTHIVSKTTEATASTTGALVVSGGLGVGGNAHLGSGGTVGGALTATAITETSDRRLKSNITTLVDALDAVQRMRGVSYLHNKAERAVQTPDLSDNIHGGVQTGFLAQEIEKIVPGSVLTDARGYKSLRYTSLIPYLVEAIKEQQEQIRGLQETIQRAEQVHKLRVEVDKLKAQLRDDAAAGSN